MRLPQCLGGWEQEEQSSFCSRAMRWGAGAGLPWSLGSLWALLNTQSSHFISAPRQESSHPSLQDSSVKSSHSLVCWRNPQWVRSVNMWQLSTVAVFILWCVPSQNLTNFQGSVRGDKTGCQELSFTYCTRVCTTTTGKSLGVCKLRKLLLWGMLNWSNLWNYCWYSLLYLALSKSQYGTTAFKCQWAYVKCTRTKICSFHNFEVDFWVNSK